jgi:hypothetical protein
VVERGVDYGPGKLADVYWPERDTPARVTSPPRPPAAAGRPTWPRPTPTTPASS